MVAIEGLQLPELEKHDGKLHYRKEMDTSDFLLVLKSMNAEKTDIDPDAWPDLIIQLARDETGRRLFRKAHREKILQWPATQLVRVVNGLGPALDDLANQLGKS